MQATTHCPGVEELERLAIGVISEEAAGPLEEHLLSCAACVARLAAVDANDTLLSALRSHSTVKNNPLEESNALSEIVSRLSEQAPVTLSTRLDLTGDPRPGKTGAASPVSNAFLAPPQASDEMGRLGGYRVLRVLGSGGMGVVFEAEDPKLKRRVALKVMKPELAAHAQSRQRFVREAQAMAALDHDHIVTIFQVGEDAGVPFLAMQFLQGESLAERLSRGQGTGHREQREGAEVGGQRSGNAESASVGNGLRAVPRVADAALLPLLPGEGRGEGGAQSSAVNEPFDDRSPHAPREEHHHAERDVYLGEASGAARLPLPPGEGRGEGGLNHSAPRYSEAPPVAPTLRGGESPSPLATASPSRSAAATFPLDEILRIGGQIADGLAAAHEHGLIHRDIKPGNIWLETSRGRPRVKILDFGLARVAQGGEELTQSAAVLGTPSYMAPEQARGGHVDARADLFSLGCVLYRMATGRPPFPGNDPLSVLMSLAISTPQAPRELNAAIPPELDALIVSLLCKDPVGRPQSAREVMERLASTVLSPAEFLANGAVQNFPVDEPLDDRSPHAPREEDHHAERDVYGGEAVDAALLPLPPREGRGKGLVNDALPGDTPTVVPTLRGGDSASPLATASPSRSAAATLSVAPALANSRRRRPPRRAVLLAASAAAAVLAGVIFYIQTDHGTLRVEINDPRIEVAIKGADLTFKQADNGADVKLSPGEKTLVVERGDFKFETDKLVLKRGDAVTVSVVLLAGEVHVKQGEKLIGQAIVPSEASESTGTPLNAAEADHSAGDANAEVFEWATQTGGRHGLSDGVPHPAALTDILALADGPGGSMLWQIGLEDCQNLTDADLKRFRRVTKPFSLSLSRTKVTDAALAELRGLPHLRSLNLDDTQITARGIKSLGVLPELYFLDIRGTSTSDADLGLLTQFPKLSKLQLDRRHLTAQGAKLLSGLPSFSYLYLDQNIRRPQIAEIAKLSQLTGMQVFGGEFDDGCLEYLKGLPNLTTLCLHCQLTDLGLATLPVVAPMLTGLDLDNNADITDAGAMHLQQLTKLTGLSLRDTHITAAGATKLQAALPNCKIDWSPRLPPPSGDPNRDAAEWVLAMGGEVYVVPKGASTAVHVTQSRDLPRGPWQHLVVMLRGPWVHDDDFRRLANLPALSTINVHNCDITGGALAHLRGLPNLATVFFVNSPVGDVGPALLNEVPSISNIVLCYTGTMDAGLEPIGRHRRLTQVGLSRNRGVTDKGVAHLRRLYALRDLDLAETAITDAGLRHLSELKQLASLEVQSTAVTDDGLAALANLKKLKNLNLDYNTITDVSMPEIAKLTGLEVLKLRSTHVGDDGIEKLKTLSKLRELYLSGTELTDEGLKPLHAMTSLKLLNVGGTQVTAAGVAELRAALPDCQVEWIDPAAKPPSAGQ